MRRSPLLDVLISRNKQKLLTATLLDPERPSYLLELARRLQVTPSSIQRELGLLVEAGILRRWRDGNRVYFQADRDCPILPELRRILLKTVGLAEVLKEGLVALSGRIRLAFVYGSLASSEERSSSDIDLMVIGAVPLSELAATLLGLEPEVGRSIHPTVYTTEEFSRKLKGGNHFLSSVLGEELLFVHGTEDDLAELAGRPAAQAAQDQPPGVARSSGRRGTGLRGRGHRRAFR